MLLALPLEGLVFVLDTGGIPGYYSGGVGYSALKGASMKTLKWAFVCVSVFIAIVVVPIVGFLRGMSDELTYKWVKK